MKEKISWSRIRAMAFKHFSQAKTLSGVGKTVVAFYEFNIFLEGALALAK